MRLPNGYGHIKKLSGKRRKPWIAETPSRYDPETKTWKCKTIGYYKTRTEAIEALTEWHKKPFDAYDTKKRTLKEVIDEYFQIVGKAKSPQTCKTYKDALRQISVLYDHDFGALTWRDYVQAMEFHGCTESYCDAIKKALSAVYGYAIRYGYVTDNEARKIKIKEINSKKSKDQTKKVWTDDQIKKVLEDKDPFARYIEILLYSGLRRGELITLRVQDVHIDAKPPYLDIRAEIAKTAESVRHVPIHNRLIPIFKELIQGKEPHEAIITTKTKKPYGGEYFDQTWARKRKSYQAGMESPAYAVHSTRHTFTTRMQELGTKQIYIDSITGHGKAGGTTNAIYTHIRLPRLKEEIDKLK